MQRWCHCACCWSRNPSEDTPPSQTHTAPPYSWAARIPPIWGETWRMWLMEDRKHFDFPPFHPKLPLSLTALCKCCSSCLSVSDPHSRSTQHQYGAHFLHACFLEVVTGASQLMAASLEVFLLIDNQLCAERRGADLFVHRVVLASTVHMWCLQDARRARRRRNCDWTLNVLHFFSP